MGCIFGKTSSIPNKRRKIPRDRPSPLPPAKLSPPPSSAESLPRREDAAAVKRRSGPAVGEGVRRETNGRPKAPNYVLRPAGSIPMGIEGDLVTVGWPAWLVAVAGEAIQGWAPRRADSFEKLDKIGQGTYSNVYKARDLDNGKIVALKKVRFDNLEPESVRFMAREIHILRQLDHPNIVKLEGLVTSRMSCSLYLVFEYMEHDLAGLASSPGLKFTEPQVKCYMQQLLCGLDHCHTRGILHRDIKGSNLLIDNSGVLKIADFGLANFFDPDHRHPLTSRVVTLWYRPPELLLGSTKYGVAVDLWSTGCILAELYAGKPIMPGRTEVEQLHKIFKLCGSPSDDYWRKSKLPHATIFKPQQPYRRCVEDTFKDFPPSALALLGSLLSIDPADRGTAASALESEFFKTKPLACDPSSLPKFPPSKEFDAKIRDEEAGRRGAVGERVPRHSVEKRGLREPRVIPAPDANAELALSLKQRNDQANSKSRSEKFNPQQEELATGFRIEPPGQAPVLEVTEDSHRHYSHRFSHSGPLVNYSQRKKARKDEDATPKFSAVADISATSGMVGARRNILLGIGGQKIDGPRVGAMDGDGRLPKSSNRPSDTTRKYDQGNHAHGVRYLHQKDDGKSSNLEQIMQEGYGSKGIKIHYSGPLSGNVEQIMKDHDRQMQRRSRMDKSKARKIGNKGTLRPYDLGVFPVYPSSRGSVPLFTSSRAGAVR